MKPGENVVSPGKWKFWTMAEYGKEKDRENKTLIMRVPHERGAKSTSNPLTEGDRKSRVIYRVTPF